MERWARINYQPAIALGENGQRLTGSAAHVLISRKAACEGMVLLKNENNLLPFRKGTKIALFGRGHIDYIKGGGGSGSVSTAYTKNLYHGLLEKEAEGKVQVYHPLSDYYTQQLKEECDFLNSLDRKVYARERLVNGVGSQEPQVPQQLMADAAAFADVAVFTISRYSCEKYERHPGKGDFLLSEQEAALLQEVKAHFTHVIVVLNIGGVMDVTWFSEDTGIQSALLAWQSGMEGGLAIADILCGDVNPSGKLTDTFARNYLDFPSGATFEESIDFVNYYEDIYNGYRYFETIPGAKDKVIYPFGYGLSYTQFQVSGYTACKDADTIRVECTVENVGKLPGKEVVQIYGEAPQGKLGKAKRVLCGFQKTRLLQPGESQHLTISFDVELLASYDDLGAVQKSAFLLEAGEYAIYGCTDLRQTQQVLSFTLADTQIISQCSPRAVPTELPHRMLADGTMQKLPMLQAQEPKPLPQELKPQYPDQKFTLFDVAEGKVSVEELVSHMSDKELGDMLYGHNTVSVSPTNGIGGGGRKSPMAIPRVPTADGPAGLRIPLEVGIYTTAFPSATQIACSWDPEIAYEVGKAIALEMKENNIGVYLAPALNVHRDPMCGRNFEYYSEDPLISGLMATAAVKGIQDQGVVATIKHLACNGKETNRRNSDSRLSERALREIYLKGFEITVKEAKPWALMTAYNMVNGVRSSAHYDIITGILRDEWGWDGLVMTDWHVLGSQVDELLAGNDLKMPEAVRIDAVINNDPAPGVPIRGVASQGVFYDLGEMITSGEVPRAIAQQSVKRVLEMIIKLGDHM